MMNKELFQEFLTIAHRLNELNIQPLLMGSLGLEFVTGKEWNVRDIDIHVPGDSRGWEAPDEVRIYRFDEIHELMKSLGYVLVDRHEHEFQKGDLSVEFGTKDTLPDFAGVALEDLEEKMMEGVSFYVPNPKQYLKIYEASSKDSYRNDNNNNKDFAKIEYLKQL